MFIYDIKGPIKCGLNWVILQNVLSDYWLYLTKILIALSKSAYFLGLIKLQINHVFP